MADIIVFTDLDGTLLDHKSYSVRAALPAVDLLIRRGCPIVPVSSKTAPEIRRWVRLLDLDGPFISENGCGIYIPVDCFSTMPEGAGQHDGEWQISLGTGIDEVRSALQKLARSAGFAFRTVDQMSREELSSLTGLEGEELDHCLAREYDLPFVISGNPDLGQIAEKAREVGLHFTRGGRFYHLTGGCHKGKAVRLLANLYRMEKADPVFIGIGDSFNDLPMFEVVDKAFLVQKPDGTYDSLVPENAARRVEGAGPAGWRAAVEEVMVLGQAW
ncbi:MAG: HAD-IIB family hydrolase [Pseudomonadota bacterium]|jgi:mannosyl-3-phosphoglycerate phosphatase